MLDKLRGKKDQEQSQSVVTPSSPTTNIEDSNNFNPDTYQYENEIDDLDRETYYEDEIQYEEGAEYDCDCEDLDSDVSEDLSYDYYDSSSDDDSYFTAD